MFVDVYDKKHSRKIKKRSVIFIVIIILIFIIVNLVILNIRLMPFVIQISRSRTTTLLTRVMNEAIANELKNNAIEYDDLVEFEKNANGDIKALKSKMNSVSLAKSRIALAVMDGLDKIKYSSIYIPLGSITNAVYLAGRGPKIEVKIFPMGYVNTDIKNSFTDAGINQTRHQILITVNASVAIMLPDSSTVNSDVSTTVCIAETILVGEVPQYYTNISEIVSPETMGKLNDYKARTQVVIPEQTNAEPKLDLGIQP